MKNLKILIPLFLAFAIISCKSDDDTSDGGNSTNPLVGTWTATNVNHTTTATGQQNASSVPVDVTVGAVSNNTYSITFAGDQNQFSANGGYSVTETFTAQGQQPVDVVLQNFQILDTGGIWATNGTNTLTIKKENREVTAEVLSLTDSTLALKQIFNGPLPDQNEANIIITRNVIITFTKQ